MKFTRYISIAIIVPSLFICTSMAMGQQSRGLIYTYVGPVLSGGFSHIEYTDWFHLYHGTKKIDGKFISGGFSFNIYSKYIAGEFSIHFMHNWNEKPLQHLYYTISGKYVGNIGEIFAITPGIGIYLESPPSTRDYLGGAGVRGILGFELNTTFDTKLIIEGSVMYGWYGKGEKSTKFSYGINLGFLFKVGRI